MRHAARVICSSVLGHNSGARTAVIELAAVPADDRRPLPRFLYHCASEQASTEFLLTYCATAPKLFSPALTCLCVCVCVNLPPQFPT